MQASTVYSTVCRRSSWSLTTKAVTLGRDASFYRYKQELIRNGNTVSEKLGSYTTNLYLQGSFVVNTRPPGLCFYQHNEEMFLSNSFANCSLLMQNIHTGCICKMFIVNK